MSVDNISQLLGGWSDGDQKCRSSKMRFFGGLSVEETAMVLKVSPVTVRRDWSSAKIWLYRELTGETDDGLGSLETAR